MTRRNLLAALHAAEEALDAANTAHAETKQALTRQTLRADLATAQAQQQRQAKRVAESSAELAFFWLGLAEARAESAEAQRDILLGSARCLPIVGDTAGHGASGPAPIYAGMVAEGWVA